MICPKLLAAMYAAGDGQASEKFNRRLCACIEDACGWWVPAVGKCGIVVIGEQTALASAEIRQRIDHYEESH